LLEVRQHPTPEASTCYFEATPVQTALLQSRPALIQPDEVDADFLTLRDGTTAQVRIAGPQDRQALRDFFGRLSPESRRRRFSSWSLPSPELIATLCASSDPRSGLTLVATRTQDTGPRIIATGSYLARDDKTAEVALAVEDAFQGKGLG